MAGQDAYEASQFSVARGYHVSLAAHGVPVASDAAHLARGAEVAQTAVQASQAGGPAVGSAHEA